MDIETIEARLKRYERWVVDLQSGMYINCVYCGHRYGLNSKVPVTMAAALHKHIAECPHHPMSKLIKAATASHHTLSSLLATREGIPDERLNELRAFIGRALEDAGVKSPRC